MVTVSSLVFAALAVSAVAGAPVAYAADWSAPNCSTGYEYSLESNGTLRQIVMSGGAVATSDNAGWSGISGVTSANGLGIGLGGTTMFAFNRDASAANVASILKWTPAGGFVQVSNSAYTTGMSGSLTSGAVDLSTGNFVFGGSTVVGGQNRIALFKYTPSTNAFSSLGYVPSSVSSPNGDLAFDTSGNLYVVGSTTASTVIYTIKAADLAAASGGLLPYTTGQSGALSISSINGIGFDANGSLYLSNSTSLVQYNPYTWAQIGSWPNVLTSGTDLGSCLSPATLSLQKNLTRARVNPADQFTLSVTSASTTNTATTTGSATGLQSAQVGPTPVYSGSTFTFAETMAPGSVSTLANYASSWQCTSTLNGVTTTIGTGTATSGSVTIPYPADSAQGPAVNCIFTNVPLVTGLTVVKTADVQTVTTVGQIVHYSFLVTNTGTIPVTDLTVADGFTSPATAPGAPSCLATTLDAGASTTCTLSYAVTQADIDHGSIGNSATASGQSDLGPVTSPPAPLSITATQTPGITVVKSADQAGYSGVDQQINYGFLVTNTGNVTLSDVTIEDTLTAPAGPAIAVICPTTPLSPGGQLMCGGSYTTTQADLDAGSIQNSATASALLPGGTTITSAISEKTVPAAQTNSLSLVKSASVSQLTAVGQTVTYSFLVTNGGNVTLHGLSVADAFAAPAGPGTTVTCPVTTLAPGISTTCTSTYTATQADMNATTIINTATATADNPAGDLVTSNPSSALVEMDAQPGISVTKSADVESVSAVGQTITYSFLVTNTGNMSLSDVDVQDILAPPAGPPITVTCPATSLEPSASMTCTALYIVTQADLDHGTITNSARATAQSPVGDPISSTYFDATVTVDQTSSLTLVKSADVESVSAAGQRITYSFLVTNIGNVTVNSLAVYDQLTSPADADPIQTSCPVTTLAPQASTTCTLVYTVTQAAIDNGGIDNAAQAFAASQAGQVHSDISTAHVAATQTPAVSLVKSADVESVSNAGQAITYSFLVTNTGNVTLTAIAVHDVLTPPAGPAVTVTCPATSLEPAAHMTCVATYMATQADVDAGSIANSATVTAQPPAGDPITSAAAGATVAVDQSAGLGLVKTASTVHHVKPDAGDQAGDTITYSFVVTNTGNVTLTAITLTDAKLGLTDVACGSGPLAPGDQRDCTAAVYSLTTADLAAGKVVNTATARAETPSEATIASTVAAVTTALHPSTGPAPGPTDDLATTGMNIAGVLGQGLLLVAAGALLLLAARRRWHPQQ